MVKMLGAFLWIGAAAWTGHHLAAERERRLRELTALLHALYRLETEIVFSRTPLGDALARIARAERACRPLFEEAVSALERRVGIERAWEAGIDAWARTSALRPEDVDLLRPLGSVLGLSDASDQRRHIRLAEAEIDTRIERVRERLSERARLSRMLGLFAGVAVALLLY